MHHPRLEALFADFDHVGLRWCLLRLPTGSGPKSGDVDLLVDGSQLAPAFHALFGQGFTRLPGWKPGLHFLSYDLPTGQWIWLHLVTELSFGPDALLKTSAAPACLERRQQQGDFFILADEDAFWELLLHCLLDRGRIAPHHRSRLQELAAADIAGDAPGPLAQVVEAALPSAWTLERIARLARDGCWTELEELACSLAVAWKRHNQVGPLQIFGARILRRLIQGYNLPRSRGLSVALLGPDGAGKSTLLAGIQETFILPVRPVYMGLTGGLLPYVNRLRLPFLVIPGRLVVFWGRYLRALVHQARGRLVIFDRYVYDYAVPTPYPLNRLERIYRWIDGHSCPGPDLVLILDAPGEVMFQRKGEYDPAMLEEWRRHFLALGRRLRQSQIVDTTRPAETVRAEVTGLIWQRWARLWSEG